MIQIIAAEQYRFLTQTQQCLLFSLQIQGPRHLVETIRITVYVGPEMVQGLIMGAMPGSVRSQGISSLHQKSNLLSL